MPRFKVSGKELFVSARLWSELEGPLPPAGFECDGCSHSPDVYYPFGGTKTFKLWPACVVHDYHYRAADVLEPRDADARAKADAILYRNLMRCIEHSGGSPFAQHRLAWLYWGRVRMWGAGAWQHGVGKPKSWWKRLREVW